MTFKGWHLIVALIVAYIVGALYPQLAKMVPVVGSRVGG